MSYLLVKQPKHKDGLLKVVMMMKLSRVRDLHMSCLPPPWEWMKSLCEEEVVEMLEYVSRESYMKKILYRKMTPKGRKMRRLTLSPMEIKFWRGMEEER
ncbi:hypothetical protein RHGRI_004784 [Rhododendron griersonianum]|uniref:Uncharacterized protein n=1 Tax=Rhododendron griersonianum TaxID=479676 RepID=A0AAV6LAV5_9ERIC|nr:hypothetical protein RHGRI_004784 [Rhododendron griersonianum]